MSIPETPPMHMSSRRGEKYICRGHPGRRALRANFPTPQMKGESRSSNKCKQLWLMILAQLFLPSGFGLVHPVD